MTIAAYRDRTSGEYPITVGAIRTMASVLFGFEPPADVLDELMLDPVEAVEPPSFDPVKQTLAEGAPAKAGGTWRQTWVVTALPPPGDDAVDGERDRRLALGITFSAASFQTADLDRERIDRSRISAMAAIMGGAQKGDKRWHGLPVDFFWIAADNTRVPMDAQTMVEFGNTVAAREGLLIVAGNDLKRRIAAGETITDITDNALWPA